MIMCRLCLLVVATGLLAVALVIPTASAEPVEPQILVGSYTYQDVGGGSRSVELPTGWGRPDIVWVQASTPGVGTTAAWLRTDDMPTGLSKDLWAADALGADGIEDINTDSFEVRAALNEPGATYGFVAIRAGSNEVDDYFAHGTYSGVGGSIDIPLGGDNTWRPDLVLVVSDTTRRAVYHTGTMGDVTNVSYQFGASTSVVNGIKRLDDGSFEVGPDASVNQAGAMYHWFALRAIPGAFEQDSYAGDGNESSVTLTDPFKPDYVLSQRLFNVAHHRFGHLPEFPADSSQDVGNAPTGGFDGATGGGFRFLKSFEIDGFTVGNGLSVVGSTYHYWALRTTPGAVEEVDVDEPDAFRVFQRDSSDKGDIRIEGAFAGSPSAIEARWNGAPWTVIDPSPTAGTFHGVLADQPTGAGALEVRAQGIAESAEVVDPVGVGDVFVVAGQSNGSGYGGTLAPAPGPQPDGSFAGLFGNDDRWKTLDDPYDSGVNQVDSVSKDAGFGSWVPHLAAELLAGGDGVPVAFVPTAKSGSSIARWSRNLSPSTLYGSMHRRVTDIGGGDPLDAARAVLWFQGEHEAAWGRNPATYKAALEQLATDVSSDFGVPLVLAGLVDIAAVPGAALDRIRAVQRQAAAGHSDIFTGPQHYDIDLADNGGDGLHLGRASDPDGSGELEGSALRWWAAIDGGLAGGHDGRGPYVSSAHLDASPTSITLTLTNDVGPLLADGTLTATAWDATDDLGDLDVTSAGIVGDGSTNEVRLALNRAVSGEATVSFGLGHSGVDAVVPTDSQLTASGAATHLPLEPFGTEPVSDPGPSNQPPVAGFVAAPTSGLVPLDVEFDASASSDPDGSIDEYRWDLDGDDEIDVARSSPLLSHTYTSDGTYTPKLSVVDDLGATDAVSLSSPIRATTTPPAGDQVSIEFFGGLGTYTNVGPITSGDVAVIRDSQGLVRVSTTVTVPSANPLFPTAYISVNISRFAFLPVYLGSVRVVDPGAGLDTNTPHLGSAVAGDDTARGTARWFASDLAGLRTYGVRWEVTDGV